MKYCVEYEDGIFTETLEVNGFEATKTWKRESGGTISGLCSTDKEFFEQFSGVLDEEVCESIRVCYDENNMTVADMDDFIMMNDVE